MPIANDIQACATYVDTAGPWVFPSHCANRTSRLLYQLDQQQIFSVVAQKLNSIEDAAVFGNVLAMLGRIEPNSTKQASVIEWYQLDNTQ